MKKGAIWNSFLVLGSLIFFFYLKLLILACEANPAKLLLFILILAHSAPTFKKHNVTTTSTYLFTFTKARFLYWYMICHSSSLHTILFFFYRSIAWLDPITSFIIFLGTWVMLRNTTTTSAEFSWQKSKEKTKTTTSSDGRNTNLFRRGCGSECDSNSKT